MNSLNPEQLKIRHLTLLQGGGEDPLEGYRKQERVELTRRLKTANWLPLGQKLTETGVTIRSVPEPTFVPEETHTSA